MLATFFTRDDYDQIVLFGSDNSSLLLTRKMRVYVFSAVISPSNFKSPGHNVSSIKVMYYRTTFNRSNV
jgi:hypothetical protein